MAAAEPVAVTTTVCDGDDNVLQLMKLNEDWDQVYRSATLGLQQRLEALELENTAIKQLNSRLLLKVEHQQVNMPSRPAQSTGEYPEWDHLAFVVHTCDVYCFTLWLQSAKEYYEQALMQELKKNQELQEYITVLENRKHHPERDCPPAKQVSSTVGSVLLLIPLNVIHGFVFSFHYRATSAPWCMALFRAPRIILLFPTWHRRTPLDATPHPPSSQLPPAWRQSGRERAIAMVCHWEHWENPSKICRI